MDEHSRVDTYRAQYRDVTVYGEVALKVEKHGLPNARPAVNGQEHVALPRPPNITITVVNGVCDPTGIEIH